MDTSVVNHGSPTVPRPRLRYHTIKGRNITLSQNNSIASRNPGVFCKGLVFSDRPIELDEIVCIKLTKVAGTWSGMFRVGLTNVDPACFRDIELPKYACPNLTYRSGYWAKSVPDRFCVQNALIHFLINESGVFLFGTNGTFRGVFMSDIDTSKSLWLMIDIYGNTESIEILDKMDPIITTQTNQVETEEREHRSIRPIVSNDTPPYIFHFLVGANACRLSSWTVRRQQGENQGYCFLQRSLRIGEQLAIRVNEVDNTFFDCIAFGLTSCNPNELNEEDLPVNFDDFVERPEYWVGVKNVVAYPKVDDILQFTITDADTSVPLWPFFDLQGSTKGIQLISPLLCRIEDSEDISISLNFGNDQPSTSQEARQTSPETYSWLPYTHRVINYDENSDNDDVQQDSVYRFRRISLNENDDDSISPRYTRDSYPVRDRTESSMPSFRCNFNCDTPSLINHDLNAEEVISSSQRTRRHQILLDNDDENVFGWRSSSQRPSAASAAIVRTTMEHVRRHCEVTPEEVAVSAEHLTPPLFSSLSHRRESLSQSPILEPVSDISRNVLHNMRVLSFENDEDSSATSTESRAAPNSNLIPRVDANTSPPPKPTPSVVPEFNDDKEAFQSHADCVVCWSNRANAAVYRCGHVCMCMECARRLSTSSGTCPMCRQTIIDVVQLFYA